MIKENPEFMDELEQRFEERFEYLKRDLNMLLRNLDSIKESVFQFNGEIEKFKKNKAKS